MTSALKLKNCIFDVKGTACIKLTNARKIEEEFVRDRWMTFQNKFRIQL